MAKRALGRYMQIKDGKALAESHQQLKATRK
jgi:hypothetical protein